MSAAAVTAVPAAGPNTLEIVSAAINSGSADISAGVSTPRNATLISRYRTMTASAPPTKIFGSAVPGSLISSAIFAASSQP